MSMKVWVITETQEGYRAELPTTIRGVYTKRLTAIDHLNRIIDAYSVTYPEHSIYLTPFTEHPEEFYGRNDNSMVIVKIRKEELVEE